MSPVITLSVLYIIGAVAAYAVSARHLYKKLVLEYPTLPYTQKDRSDIAEMSVILAAFWPGILVSLFVFNVMPWLLVKAAHPLSGKLIDWSTKGLPKK